MSSRNPADLHPALQPLYHQFLDACHAAGIDILCTCTYRSGEEQNALYAQGRTAPGRIVTNAKAGQSRHNFSIEGRPAAKAFDVVPLTNGKPNWNSADPVWQQIGAIGERLGLEWAGHWRTFREFPHFQLKG